MRILAALVVSLLLAAPATAKTIRLGSPPVAQVAIPDDWEPTETKRGIEANSDDGEIYISIEVFSATKVEDAVTRAVAYLMSEGVEIDTKTERKIAGKLGGMDAAFVEYSGKDEDGEATEVSIGVVGVNPSTVLIVTYWGSKEGEEANGKELEAIANSIKPIN